MGTPQKVFITGASSGIGLALAAEYVRRGAIVGLVARRKDALERFRDAHPQHPILIYAADVRDADALADATKDFFAKHGCPDIVIANAGVSRGTITGLGDLQTFRDVMDTNYYGMVATFEPFAAEMAAAHKGTLVGISSVAGVRGLPGSGAYSASKAAARTYLESLRVEMRPRGVSVVTIAPGFIRTPMTARNPYRMPFLMDVEQFAHQAARAIERKKRYVVLPWQMRFVAMMLHAVPRWLYDAAMKKAPHKPRAKAD